VDALRCDRPDDCGEAPAPATYPASDATLLGIPVIESPMVADGVVLVFGNREVIAIGTAPIDNSEWCQREALRIVRTGLADVLGWLGEPPWRPPATGAGILASLKLRGARTRVEG
jgi:hypothetical protein